MHADAGALAGGVEARHHGTPVHVGVDAAHRVVLAGRDRDRLFDRVDALEVDGEVADAGERLHDLRGPQVPQVEVDVVLAADAPALEDLGGDRSRGDVARRQLHGLGRVLAHETLAEIVDEIAALAAGALGHEDVGGEQARGMELDELHVLERHAGVVGDGGAAAGGDDGVGGVAVDAAGAAGGHDHGVGGERLEAAADHVVGDDPAAAAVLDDEVGDEHLDVHRDLALVGALDEAVEQVVPGLVGAVAGARVAGAAEGPLGDAPVVEAAERAAPVVHLEDDARSVAGHLDGGVLVGQVVRALDGVEGVLLGRVVVALGVVGESRVDAALGGAGVAAAGVDLAEDRHVDAGRLGLDGGAQPGQAAADDDELMMDHAVPLSSPRPRGPRCRRRWPGCRRATARRRRRAARRCSRAPSRARPCAGR